MNKSPVAILAAIIAVATMFATSAEAGFRIRLGFGGPLPSFTAHGNGGGYYEKRHYHRQRYLARRVVKKEKTYVAKRNTEPKVAKSTKSTTKRESVAALPSVEPDVIADSENSSITTASLEPETAASTVVDKPVTPIAAKSDNAAPQTPEPAKAASKLDCKKFFPSVGMTLTVPCE